MSLAAQITETQLVLLVLPPAGLSLPEAVQTFRACLQESDWVVVECFPMKIAPGLAPSVRMTAKQKTILQWLAEGKSNKEIAALTAVLPSTVDGQLRRIFQKLGVNTRGEAVAKAIREGLI